MTSAIEEATKRLLERALPLADDAGLVVEYKARPRLVSISDPELPFLNAAYRLAEYETPARLLHWHGLLDGPITWSDLGLHVVEVDDNIAVRVDEVVSMGRIALVTEEHIQLDARRPDQQSESLRSADRLGVIAGGRRLAIPPHIACEVTRVNVRHCNAHGGYFCLFGTMGSHFDCPGCGDSPRCATCNQFRPCKCDALAGHLGGGVAQPPPVDPIDFVSWVGKVDPSVTGSFDATTATRDADWWVAADPGSRRRVSESALSIVRTSGLTS